MRAPCQQEEGKDPKGLGAPRLDASGHVVSQEAAAGLVRVEESGLGARGLGSGVWEGGWRQKWPER